MHFLPNHSPARPAHMAAEEATHVSSRSVVSQGRGKCVSGPSLTARSFTTETQPFAEVQLSAEDACSFQFPEEERGEQTEEKCHLGGRWP